MTERVEPTRFVNIGIMAHVDAGKTTLTERLLFSSGVIRSMGSVDRGDTTTDTMALERQRGITIRSAVVAFQAGDVQINIIDTPGHSDFIAEVERAITVLDAAILVVSAVEGVQAHTLVLMRTLRRLGLPTLIFVNKIDRMGARYDSLLRDLRRDLSSRCVAMVRVEALGQRSARAIPFAYDDPDLVQSLAEILADADESFLRDYIGADFQLGPERLRAELRRQLSRGELHPIFFGSALTGEGVASLVDELRALHALETETGDDLRARVFKIENDASGRRVVYARVYRGELAPSQRVTMFRALPNEGVKQWSERLSSVGVFRVGARVIDGHAGPGAIAKLGGLDDAAIGDQLGSAEGISVGRLFDPPTIEALVRPAEPSQRARLWHALGRIAEQDPLISLGPPGPRGASLRLYGEVQREVIDAVLRDEFGLKVEFDQPSTIFVERPVGVGEALEEIRMDAVNFFWATIGLRVEPGPPDCGVVFQRETHLGSLPMSFQKAIEETVHETLQQGLYGWEVGDIVVTLTATGYASPVSAAGDFRNATPLVLAAALQQAGTRVYEPIYAFTLELPVGAAGQVLARLAQARGVVENHTLEGVDGVVIAGRIAAREVQAVRQQLPELTGGRGVMFTQFAGYQPFHGVPPTRPRTGANPYDREQYMLHKLGRVQHEGDDS